MTLTDVKSKLYFSYVFLLLVLSFSYLKKFQPLTEEITIFDSNRKLVNKQVKGVFMQHIHII